MGLGGTLWVGLSLCSVPGLGGCTKAKETASESKPVEREEPKTLPSEEAKVTPGASATPAPLPEGAVVLEDSLPSDANGYRIGTFTVRIKDGVAQVKISIWKEGATDPPTERIVRVGDVVELGSKQYKVSELTPASADRAGRGVLVPAGP